MESHYNAKHKDLVDLGLSLVSGQQGQPQAVVKDTLLTQVLVFILTNKPQVKRQFVDYEAALAKGFLEKLDND